MKTYKGYTLASLQINKIFQTTKASIISFPSLILLLPLLLHLLIFILPQQLILVRIHHGVIPSTPRKATSRRVPSPAAKEATHAAPQTAGQQRDGGYNGDDGRDRHDRVRDPRLIPPACVGAEPDSTELGVPILPYPVPDRRGDARGQQDGDDEEPEAGQAATGFQKVFFVAGAWAFGWGVFFELPT